MLSGQAKVSKAGDSYGSKKWGSLRRKKGSSLERDKGTIQGTQEVSQPLPSHLQRGKNLSKRFRKSCRNWAASKGLISQKTCKDVENIEDPKDTTEDIVVIDLDEDPEASYHRPSEDSDIGKLVADLVLDAKRRNTLPRSGSKHSIGKESVDMVEPLAALAQSTAVNEEAEDVNKAELTSPSDLLDKAEDDSEAINVELKDEEEVVGQILETSFDEDEPSENIPDETISAEDCTNKDMEAKDNISEIFESIGETLFYNGITLNDDFAVRAGYSGELFKEETTTPSETSQLDQLGFTELNTFSISTDECLHKNINEKEDNDEKPNVSNEDLYLNVEINHDESSSSVITKDEEKSKNIIHLNEETRNDTMSGSEDEEEEVTETLGEKPVADLHTNELLVETSEHDFNSIAKISALDFLNDDESDEEEDEEDDDELEENGLYKSYFGSSFMFSHPLFPKENSFPSLSVAMEEEERQAKSGSYLEAINLELDNKENPWQNTAFRISSTEFRINPFYKDEDSLSNSLVLNSDSQNPGFNYNFQEFFDLWEIFSQEGKDDKQAAIVHENSVGLCNLEAIQEEDETDEDYERDENNNYDDDDTEYESDNADEETGNDIIDRQVQKNTYFHCENSELIELEGGKNVTVDNSEKSGTVAVMSEESVENCSDTDDYKLYEGLSFLFQTKEQHFNSSSIEKDIIGFGYEESIKDYVESFLNSLILNIVSLEKLEDNEYRDDIDDEYYSCDSPIDDEDLYINDHLSEFGYDKGLSTDEGIEATTDEEDDLDDEINKVKSKIELDGSVVSTKF